MTGTIKMILTFTFDKKSLYIYNQEPVNFAEKLTTLFSFIVFFCILIMFCTEIQVHMVDCYERNSVYRRCIMKKGVEHIFSCRSN